MTNKSQTQDKPLSLGEKILFGGLASIMGAALVGAGTGLYYMSFVEPAPEGYQSARPPEWAKNIEFSEITPETCTLKNIFDQTVIVSHNPASIGNGLNASKLQNNCLVEDSAGLRCHWNKNKIFTGCEIKEAPERLDSNGNVIRAAAIGHVFRPH